MRLETVSREQAADSYEFRLIATALEPLSAQGDCEDPQRAATRARRLLAAAGLAHIRVKVEIQDGPCFDPGGYELTPGTLTLHSARNPRASRRERQGAEGPPLEGR